MLDESLLTEPEQRARPSREFLTSTPGKLTLIGTVLIIAALAAGATTSAAIGDREEQINVLREHTEPLANAAQELYSSLSIANATATTAFLSGGTEPSDLRDRYNQAVGQAAAGLVTASNGVSPDDIRSLTLLTDISNDLAVYTGIVATARANNRTGNPIGVAYLSEASALMEHSILPLAQQLYADQANAVATTQGRTARFPITGIVLSALVLVALVLVQVYLAGRSRRRLNPGLVLASILMALFAIWLSAAGLTSISAVQNARSLGAEPLDTLARARILAQQARADETLALLRRGSDTRAEESYAERESALAEILDRYRGSIPNEVAGTQADEAVSALDGWVSAHRGLRQKLMVGDYPGAVEIAGGTGPQHSTTQFARLDAALVDEITRLRDRQLDLMARAYSSLSLLAMGSVAVGVLCGFAVGAGIWPRLNEYH